ncbi:MAG: EamA family transporter, partial [Candidatus Aenigmatarchaeota archaeon]
MYWFILGVIASIFWGITSLIDKAILTNYIKNPYTYHLFLVLSMVPIALVYYLIFPVNFDPYFSFVGFLGGTVLGISFLLYNKALMVEEVSRVTPLMRLTSIFTLLFGFLILGEELTFLQYVGVLVLTAGGFLISWRGKGIGGVSK